MSIGISGIYRAYRRLRAGERVKTPRREFEDSANLLARQVEPVRHLALR